LQPQAFKNGEVHDWYRTVWGYSDHLVASLLDEFQTRAPMRVLDPFCGTGTTLVECMKRGIDSAGIDANPVSCLAARVKTNWNLTPDRLIEILEDVEKRYRRHAWVWDYRKDPTYQYLKGSGMLARGWISARPLRKVIEIKRCIQETKTTSAYKNALTVILMDTAVRSAANVKFGPELYCGNPKFDIDVFSLFADRVYSMSGDLRIARLSGPFPSAIVVEGDSRDCGTMRRHIDRPAFSHVICSPPYPAEHDYTRNSRLELAIIERVNDRESLRSIKRNMVRSHSKNIYVDDADSSEVAQHRVLAGLVRRIDERAAYRDYGFAKLYSRVTTEYFGGMKRHLQNVRPLLRRDAILAYVVGDQSSYLQVPIKTADILATFAEETGYKVIDVRHWRDRTSRSASKTIGEHILIMRKLG
jgi:hypothetical protein